MPISLTTCAGTSATTTLSASGSISGLNGGTNIPAGAVVVVGFYDNGGSAGLVSPKLGGYTLTPITSDQSRLYLYSGIIGGSPAADVLSQTAGPNYAHCSVALWYMTGSAFSAASFSQTDPGSSDPQVATSPLTIASGGVGFAVYGCDTNFTAGTTIQWGNPSGAIASDTYNRTDGSALFGSYHSVTAGTFNPGVTGSSSLAFKNNAIATATFNVQPVGGSIPRLTLVGVG